MNIRNQKKIIILLAVFTIIVVAFNKSYALFQTTAVSDKPVVQITTGDELPPITVNDFKLKLNSNNSITEDGIIYLSGSNEDINFNYVWYSGKLWRITAIYPDGTMKMITQDEITAITWGENTTYQGSWIYQWLNEDFKDTLYNKENIIVQNASWNVTPDEIPITISSNGKSIKDNVAKPPTDATAEIVTEDVGLLNVYEYYQSYKNLGTDERAYGNGYLNIRYYWWLINPYSSEKVWQVGTDGNMYYYDPYSHALGVRPSVNLKSDIQLKGEGTENNPYTITIDKEKGKPGELINTRLSGEYVWVANKIYRIVGIENGTTKLTSVQRNFYEKDFGNRYKKPSWVDSVNSGNRDYWGYYLNNSWITSNLRNYITEGTYYLGQVDSASYKNSICSENNTSDTTKNCEKTSTWVGFVGLPRFGEMFSAQLYGYGESVYLYLITPKDDSNIWAINPAGAVTDYYTSESFDVRPSINLKSEVKISGGSGTESSPYELSVQ